MAAPSTLNASPNVEAARHFNRFYTRQIGVLDEGHLHSHFSLAEVRVLYELAHRQQPTAAEICNELHLDRGYLSRMLRRFESQGLIEKTVSQKDGREMLLHLTRRGETEFAKLNAQANHEVGLMLRNLSVSEQRQIVAAMHTIERLFDSKTALASSSAPYHLRPHRPGDMGWVTHRHGVLYAEEYGWDEQFEALVAEIAAHFIQNFDARRERCWIAEKNGEIVGSVFLVKKTKAVAKLRLLLVEPKARGSGIGKRLVEECVHFARHAGYKKITLWTQSVLGAARHIYKEAGFRVVFRKSNRSSGHDLVAETWELNL